MTKSGLWLLIACAACASPPVRSQPLLDVPGLPRDPWVGFAPGSWARLAYSRDGFRRESRFLLLEDRSILEGPMGGDGFRMGHGLGSVGLPVLRMPQWMETSDQEVLEIDGRHFNCRIRRGRILVPICGNALQAGLKNPVDWVKLWWAPDAPTPGGVLRWEHVAESGSRSVFRYTKIGNESNIEFEVTWREGDGHRGRLVLREDVPGRLVELTSQWDHHGKRTEHAWKLLECHPVLAED